MRIFENETRLEDGILPIQGHSVKEKNALRIDEHFDVFEFEYAIRGPGFEVEFKLIAQTGTAAAENTQAQSALHAFSRERFPNLLDGLRSDVNLLLFFRRRRINDVRSSVAFDMRGPSLMSGHALRRFRFRLLRFVIGNSSFDRVFGQNRAVNLYRRKAELVHDIGVLDIKSLIDRLALQPFGSQRRTGDRAAATESFELGIFNDAGVGIHLHLQLHDVAALGGAHHTSSNGRVALIE